MEDLAYKLRAFVFSLALAVHIAWAGRLPAIEGLEGAGRHFGAHTEKDGGEDFGEMHGFGIGEAVAVCLEGEKKQFAGW